jgi:hypothetical protein
MTSTAPSIDLRGPHLVRLFGGPHHDERPVIWAAAADHLPSTIERVSKHCTVVHHYRLNEAWTGRHIVVDGQALPVYEWVAQ